MTENMPELPSPEMTAGPAGQFAQAALAHGRRYYSGCCRDGPAGLALIALSRNPAAAANVRDIFIILMALESLVGWNCAGGADHPTGYPDQFTAK